MRTRTTAWGALFTAALALGCGGTPAPKTGTLSGLVTDTRGQPLAGVDVETDPATQYAVTAADGSWRMEGVAAGTYTVKASLTGYVTASKASVVLAGGGSTIVDLSLAPVLRVGRIQGKVTSAKDAAAIAGATITATPDGGTASSAADGTYTITAVPVGSYQVAVTATGFVAASRSSVTVTADATTTVDLSMSPVVVYDSTCTECHVSSEKLLADLAADPLPVDMGSENTGEG